MLPELVPIHQLESYHSQYKVYRDTWLTIADLREGAPAIMRQPEKWLLRRPGEPEDIYQLRLAKLSYTPVMSTAIREFVAKLCNSPVAISGIDPESSFWAKFLAAIDGETQNQKAFLTAIFSSLLYFGRVYVGVDLPVLGIYPRSKAEDPEVAPVCHIYEPLQVINWGEYLGKPWYLTKQTNYANAPLALETVKHTWTFWTAWETVVYETEVILNNQGQLEWVIQDGNRVRPKDALIASRRMMTNGKPSLANLVLPQELWTGAQVYRKQIQHTLIESSWTDAGSIAGTVQRIFVPPDVAPNDPRFSVVTPDYSDIKDGNPYILVGADYKFVESPGGAIANLTSQLETIERQIKDLVSMGYQGSQSASESGASKEVDMAILNDTMKTYGEKVALLYQDILQAVARVSGSAEVPTVQGLDVYSASTLESMIKATVDLLAAEMNLPPTAKRIWYSKLVDMLVGAVSATDKDAIESELEDMSAPNRLDPNNPEDVQMVMDTLGVSQEEAVGMM